MSKRLSRRLSYVLRHHPEQYGLELQEGGWVAMDALLAALDRRGQGTTQRAIEELVRTSDKQRFALSEDGRRIRANQGHSVPIDLQLEPAVPPETLYHGTVHEALAGIRRTGLVKGARHHVHLSPDVATATAVGARRGRAIVLEVAAGAMRERGYDFYRSANGVWLTDHVPLAFITFPQQ